MLSTLQMSDFQMLSEKQIENFEIFEADQPEDNYYPMVFSIDACPPEEEDYDPQNLEQYFKRREECSKLSAQLKSEGNQLSNTESDECSENPLLEMKTDSQLKSQENPLLNDNSKNWIYLKDFKSYQFKKHPLLEIGTNIRLKLKRNPFFKNSPGINYLKPP